MRVWFFSWQCTQRTVYRGNVLWNVSPCSLINFHLPSHHKEIIIFRCYCKLYFTFQQYRGTIASRGLVPNLLRLNRNISVDCKCIQDKPATGQATLPASSRSAPPLELNKFVFFFCCPPSCRPSALPHHRLGTQQKRQGSLSLAVAAGEPYEAAPEFTRPQRPRGPAPSAGVRGMAVADRGTHPAAAAPRSGAERQARYPPPATSRLCGQRPPPAGPARQRLAPPRPASPRLTAPQA